MCDGFVKQSGNTQLCATRKNGMDASWMRATFAPEMLCIFRRERRLKAVISDGSMSS